MSQLSDAFLRSQLVATNARMSELIAQLYDVPPDEPGVAGGATMSVRDMRMALRLAAMDAVGIGGVVDRIAEDLVEVPPGGPGRKRWFFPVGSEEFPVEKWYVSVYHDLTGRVNDGYGHTGCDFNVQVLPRGDVDRGQPVFAVTDGVVVASSYSRSYLGSVVVAVSHYGVPLYVRYWHLADDGLPEVGAGVVGGQKLGVIGNWVLPDGGDHVHLDMALQEFKPHWWWVYHPEITWVNPLLVLKTHLDPAVVDAMCSMSD